MREPRRELSVLTVDVRSRDDVLLFVGRDSERAQRKVNDEVCA